MASGELHQFHGPFPSSKTLQIPQDTACKIGITINEKDIMNWNNPITTADPQKMFGDFYFQINGKNIHIGRTFRYETDNQINNTTIVFPNGAPAGTIVDIVYYDDDDGAEGGQ